MENLLTVFISRIRFFGTTFSATGIPSFFRTPAYTSPKPPEASLCAIKYRARSGSTTALRDRIYLDTNKQKKAY